MTFFKALKIWKKEPFSPSLLFLKKELLSKSQNKSHSLNWNQLSLRDQRLLEEIEITTARKNQNNVTRTMSYLDFYAKHPEIHWALLGHMVSRNGGWNMTDLKGELLTRLLSDEEQQDFFHFLERGNWLIFQDVYPQFLLYEESLKQGNNNYFYLLPYFHVSVFMQVLWNYFMTTKDAYTLAIALVINEQSYLEKRVIQNAQYRKKVLNTIEFKLQDVLSLNQILFPYQRSVEDDPTGPTPLMGQTLHHFASLDERILLGKRLYQLIFDHPQRLTQVKQWAMTHRHTGSRRDFWPHLFNHVRETVPGSPYERRIVNCEPKAGRKRLYSPMLIHAWKDIQQPPSETEDWYEDWEIIHYLSPLEERVEGEIQHAYCKTLEKIELAIIAHEIF